MNDHRISDCSGVKSGKSESFLLWNQMDTIQKRMVDLHIWFNKRVLRRSDEANLRHTLGNFAAGGSDFRKYILSKFSHAPN